MSIKHRLPDHTLSPLREPHHFVNPSRSPLHQLVRPMPPFVSPSSPLTISVASGANYAFKRAIDWPQTLSTVRKRTPKMLLRSLAIQSKKWNCWSDADSGRGRAVDRNTALKSIEAAWFWALCSIQQIGPLLCRPHHRQGNRRVLKIERLQSSPGGRMLVHRQLLWFEPGGALIPDAWLPRV